MYERITRKLFAVVRYQLYQKIKIYWAANKDAIIAEIGHN
jgi:hypothetical protein